MAKVSDLLRLPAFRGIHVLSGENGLQRKVEHVTVMEVPDIKRWLKGNSDYKLLLCTQKRGSSVPAD